MHSTCENNQKRAALFDLSGTLAFSGAPGGTYDLVHDSERASDALPDGAAPGSARGLDAVLRPAEVR